LRSVSAIAKLKENSLDGLIVSSPANISYLTEFSSRDAYLLLSKAKSFYFTDSRYIEEVKNKLKPGTILKKINGSAFKLIADTCLKSGLKRIGFEERNLSFAEYLKIEEPLLNRAELVPTHSLIEEIRQVKETGEIEKIRKACAITVQALKFAPSILKTGKAEIEIAGDLEHFIRYHGACTAAFQIIVASGPNSSFPHHLSSRRKLQNNEPVMIDMGAQYLGYNSDLTRVFFVGKISLLARKIYAILANAQKLAIKKIAPGIKAKEIDKISRQYIAGQGYSRYFQHSLGHGIGLEAHEQPHLSYKDDTALEAGMVVTVEPAIYLPGKFGIRREDMILVTPKGCEVLSGALH
jgi:Xaa-Pro aminopeptidase